MLAQRIAPYKLKKFQDCEQEQTKEKEENLGKFKTPNGVISEYSFNKQEIAQTEITEVAKTQNQGVKPKRCFNSSY